MTDPPLRHSRAQYTSRACDECRRRKVKCSGTEPCQCCVAAQTTCHFSQDGQRGRKRMLEAQAHQNVNRNIRATRPRTEVDTGRRAPLEDELTRIREDVITTQQQPRNIQPQVAQTAPLYQDIQDVPPESQPSDLTRSAPEETVDAESWFGHGSALLGTQNRVLQSLSAQNSPNDETRSSDNDGQTVVQDREEDGSMTILIPCALSNNSRLAPLIRFFFMNQNNCFYCLDSDQFVARLSHLLEHHSLENGQLHIPSNQPELISLAALACIVLAFAEFLSIDPPSVTRETSTSNFTHQMWNTEARRMLELYPKQSPVNIDIVQFYLIATYYGAALDCISQEPVNGTYQAIVMTITSAYSIGLNNEARWAHLTKEEKTSRRCLWASIDLMDRQVAYKCGRPCLIQDSEVAVRDLADDIKAHDALAKRNACGNRKDSGTVSKEGCFDNSSVERASTTTALSLPIHLRLKYIQGLIEITRAFKRAWRSFFAVRGPSSCEKEEVQTVDALLQRIQRNLPAELIWDTDQFKRSPKTSETNPLFRIRLLLYTRINVLRLAIHHASIRGRKGDSNLAERYKAAEYQYILALCDDISCTALAALFAYLDCCAPGSCLTTYVASTALECIYHRLAIAQLGVADGILDSCQLSGRMIATLTGAINIFRKAISSSSSPKVQLPKIILPIIEGILNQQKTSSQPSAPTNQAQHRAVTAGVLPSLKDQLSSNRPDHTCGMPDTVVQCDQPASQDRTTDFNASFLFDPSLLPAPFIDNGMAFDFVGNGFFAAEYDMDLNSAL